MSTTSSSSSSSPLVMELTFSSARDVALGNPATTERVTMMEVLSWVKRHHPEATRIQTSVISLYRADEPNKKRSFTLIDGTRILNGIPDDLGADHMEEHVLRYMSDKLGK